MRFSNYSGRVWTEVNKQLSTTSTAEWGTISHRWDTKEYAEKNQTAPTICKANVCLGIQTQN